MAYKVGDKVRIVSERPDSKNYVDGMVRFLGKEITISKPKESKPKVGDKFVVTVKGGKFGHGFGIGDIVTLVNIQQDDGCFRLVDKSGFIQILHPSEVRPYKEKAK